MMLRGGSGLVRYNPAAQTVDMPTISLQSESSVEIESTLTPNLCERDLLRLLARLLETPSVAQFIHGDAERRTAILEV